MPLGRLLTLCLRPLARTAGARCALDRFVEELRAQRRHRSGVRESRRYRGRDALRLHAGCGDRPKEGWVNIDLFHPRANLRLDLREALPFDDGSVELVYSEHVFEHLDHPRDTTRFLAECRRVMAPGAAFHVGVPDTEWPLKAYVNDDPTYFEMARDGMHPAWCDMRLYNVNWHFREGGEHRWAWDRETLTRVLEAAGFCDVSVREFDPDLDSEDRQPGTLYLVARNPG